MQFHFYFLTSMQSTCATTMSSWFTTPWRIRQWRHLLSPPTSLCSLQRSSSLCWVCWATLPFRVTLKVSKWPLIRSKPYLYRSGACSEHASWSLLRWPPEQLLQKWPSGRCCKRDVCCNCHAGLPHWCACGTRGDYMHVRSAWDGHAQIEPPIHIPLITSPGARAVFAGGASEVDDLFKRWPLAPVGRALPVHASQEVLPKACILHPHPGWLVSSNRDINW